MPSGVLLAQAAIMKIKTLRKLRWHLKCFQFGSRSVGVKYVLNSHNVLCTHSCSTLFGNLPLMDFKDAELCYGSPTNPFTFQAMVGYHRTHSWFIKDQIMIFSQEKSADYEAWVCGNDSWWGCKTAAEHLLATRFSGLRSATVTLA